MKKIVVVLGVVCMAICLVHSQGCEPVPSGLVSWWPADGNARDIAGGNNGTLVNGVTYVTGEVGEAFSFNNGGTQAVDIPYSSSLNITNQVTIEFWMKADTNNPMNSFQGLVTSDYYWISIDVGNPNLGVYGVDFAINDKGTFYQTANANGGGAHISAGVWHHIAGTYDGTNLQLYVDGQASGNPMPHTGAISPLVLPGEFVSIGSEDGRASCGCTGRHFWGLIDEASIYSRALSSNEIAAIYNAGSAGKCTSTTSGVPVISSFTPASGATGTTVTLLGANFNPVAANNTVFFGSVQAVVSAASATSLTVNMPAGATYAPITETVGGLTAYSRTPFLPTFFSSGVLTNSSFGPQITLPTGNNPGQVVIADFDGDGKPDLAVNTGDHNVYIYRNISTNGTLTAGSFATPVVLPLGTGGENKMVASDIDGDGKPDLVLLDYNGSQVMVLQNLCTPGSITTNSFGSRVNFAVGSYPRGVAVRDLDGDGKPDIVVANWGSNTISVLRNIGTVGSITTNSFAPAVQFASGADCEDVAIADLDGDGKPDVVTVNETNSNNSAVSVFRNISRLGNIAFAPRVDFQGPIYSYQLAIGDMDGDGKLDVVFVSFATGQSLSVYRSRSTPGSITFAPRIDFGLGGWGNGVALGDLDGSGKPDVAVPTQISSQLSLFRNISTPGSFTNSSLAAALDFASGSNPIGVAIGDLDGDGRPDIVFANDYSATISIYQNVVPFGGPPVIASQPTNQAVVVGQTANLSVTASGTQPLNYQWSVNGANIVGATNSMLTLAAVQISQAGNYTVLVANSYGSTNSAVATLTVNTLVCDTPPSGLVGWWKGDGDGSDSVGGDNATVPAGVTYAPAEVGLGFNLNGNTNRILAPDAPQLDFGPNQDFSIEAWIQPLSNPGNYTDLSGEVMTVISKRYSPNTSVALGYEMYLGGGRLCFQMIDSLNNGGNYYNLDAESDLRDGKFHHVAVTVQRNSTAGLQFYVDGQLVATFDPTVVTGDLSNTSPLRIGNHPDPGISAFYHGIIDEASIYNRALSSNEIAAIYSAGSAGKCFTPVAPVVTTQPANQTVLLGGTASFSVTASGTQPLNYQWSLNGTNINNATNPTLTLNDVQLNQTGNYSVLVANAVGSTNSIAAVLTVALPPIITQQPQSQVVVSYSAASFIVEATGTGPLNYQWRKGGTNLVDGGNMSGSATTNFNLASVSLSDAGNYDVVVSNPYATTNSAVAVLTVPQTGMLLGSASAMSGNAVVVPVLMNALGLENTFLASVGYDPTKLVLQNVQLGQATAGAYLQEVDTKTNSGLVGFAILLGNGPTVPVGTNEQVALLTFQALPVTSNTTVSLFFTNNPTLQQTYDNNFDLLPTTYSNAVVTLLPAEYEADVYPRTNGDHQVTVPDWGEIGRMVAGLDVPTNSDEMLRADCAPRNAPDGVLRVADWVQAGRYALGLDPLTLVTIRPAVQNGLKSKPLDSPVPTRTLQIGNVSAQRGQTVSVPVQLVCTTNENAVGLTVNFNTNQLKLTGISLGSATAGFGRTNINYRPGKLGVIVAMWPPGKSLAAGTNQVLVLQFTTSTNASGQAALALDNSVVQLQVVDTSANALAANYVSGAVTLPPQPALATAKTGANLQLTWPISTGTFQVQSANSASGPWTNTTLAITTNGASATVTVTATNQQQYFRLVGQ
jgi:hypothetical protein